MVAVNPVASQPTTRFARGTQELRRMDVQQEQRERMIEDDVAEIVHDLKSPLSAISLEAVLLGEKLTRGDRATSLHSIARINSNVAYLDRLVLDLLDACAIASGQLKLSRYATDLGELLDRVVNRVVANANRPRIVLDASSRMSLALDELRIERVVANLLDNAIKYTPASSPIVVRLSTYASSACVSIIDTGPGISTADLGQVFDRYQRAGTSRGRAGSGLGLYVCKKIVEAHGGTIGVESIRGVGSRFFFELPAVQRT
jgi:two-component system sensor histidine kinase BaeS